MPRAGLVLPWLGDNQETLVLVWTLPVWDVNLHKSLPCSNLGDPINRKLNKTVSSTFHSFNVLDFPPPRDL